MDINNVQCTGCVISRTAGTPDRTGPRALTEESFVRRQTEGAWSPKCVTQVLLPVRWQAMATRRANKRLLDDSSDDEDPWDVALQEPSHSYLPLEGAAGEDGCHP